MEFLLTCTQGMEEYVGIGVGGIGVGGIGVSGVGIGVGGVGVCAPEPDFVAVAVALDELVPCLDGLSPHAESEITPMRTRTIE